MGSDNMNSSRGILSQIAFTHFTKKWFKLFQLNARGSSNHLSKSLGQTFMKLGWPRISLLGPLFICSCYSYTWLTTVISAICVIKAI